MHAINSDQQENVTSQNVLLETVSISSLQWIGIYLSINDHCNRIATTCSQSIEGSYVWSFTWDIYSLCCLSMINRLGVDREKNPPIRHHYDCRYLVGLGHQDHNNDYTIRHSMINDSCWTFEIYVRGPVITFRNDEHDRARVKYYAQNKIFINNRLTTKTAWRNVSVDAANKPRNCSALPQATHVDDRYWPQATPPWRTDNMHSLFTVTAVHKTRLSPC